MSSHLYLHLGVYIRVEPKITTVNEILLKCPSRGCVRFNKKLRDEEYCSKCGAKAVEEVIPHRTYATPSMKIFGEDKFYFPHSGGDRLMPQQYGLIVTDNSGDYNHADNGETPVTPVDPTAIDHEIVAFTEEFSHELGRLKEEGWEYQVCWGLIRHYH